MCEKDLYINCLLGNGWTMRMQSKIALNDHDSDVKNQAVLTMRMLKRTRLTII
jgi:hypothetical protein